MKTLFDSNGKYSAEALEISDEFAAIAEAYIEKYAKQGYSVRDLAGLYMRALLDAECSFMLRPMSECPDYLD